MQEISFAEKHIRATVHDARAIAEVQVAAWKTTYHGIFPASLLEALSVDKRETSWKEILLEARPDAVTLVACNPAGEVVGFASGGAERTGSLLCNDELHAIYLLEAIRGQGLGTLLLRRLARTSIEGIYFDGSLGTGTEPLPEILRSFGRGRNG
jgi:GNAT superfamily N-acetyltransferase